MSLDSDVDPDIAAAFSDKSSSPASSSAVDQDIADAFKDTSKNDAPKGAPGRMAPAAERDPLKYAAGSVVGGAETLLSGITGGVGSLADAVTGSDPGTHDWAYRPRTDAGKEMAAGLSKAAGTAGNAVFDNALAPIIRKSGGDVEAAKTTLSERVPEALGAVGTVTGAAGLLRPRATLTPMDAQSIVDKAHASQNMGAAAAAPNVSNLPPEIQQAIVKSNGDYNPVALQRHIDAVSLPIPMKLRKGMATDDPTQFAAEANARAKLPQIADSDKELNTNLIDNLDEIRRDASPGAVGNDHVQNGQALLDKYKDYDAPIKADVTAKYKKLIDANGGSVPIDTGSFLGDVDSTLKKQYLTKSVPPAAQELIDGLRAGEPLDFEGFEAARTRLAEAQRNGGPEGAAAKVIRDKLEQLPLSADAAKLKGLANDARSAAKARFNAIEADPAYEAAVNDTVKPGEASPLADDFVKKYVIGGKKANLDLMKQKFANDPEAQGTIKAAALNYLKSKSGIDAYSNEGNFSQHGYNKALSELEPRIDSLLDPDTADQVRTLGKVARYVKKAPSGSPVNSSNTFTAAAGEGASHLATGVIDAHTLGMGGKMLNSVIRGRSDKAFLEDALAPGAGIAK